MLWLRLAVLSILLLTACAGPFAVPPNTPTAELTPTTIVAPTERPSTAPSRTTISESPTPIRSQPATRTPPEATATGVAVVTTTPPAVVATKTATADVAWPVFNHDPARSGVNPNERIIDADNVGRLVVLWTHQLPDAADSTPVYRSGRLFLTMRNGSTIALDARTGAQIWVATTSGPKITNSSPALDPSGTVVYGYGLDGFVHKYDAATGREISTGGWPVRVTWLTEVEKESSALNLANGKLYVTTSGYIGDQGHYDGHLVVVDLASGASTVFNTLCSGIRSLLVDRAGQADYCQEEQSGVWARAGAVVDPSNGNVFIASGNGPWNGSTSWGDSVLELTGDGHQLVDSYTPTNQADLDRRDVDLGSTVPALLPEQPSSKTPFLAVQGGKDGKLRLLNRRDLSGRGRIGQLGGELQVVDAPGHCQVLTAPAAWTDSDRSAWLYVANGCGLAGFRLVTDSSGQSRLQQQWQVGEGGTSPVVANGVLYLARSGTVEAREPRSGHLLWSSTSSGQKGSIGRIHWESPIVVDGRLIISDESGNVTAFGLL